MLQSLPKVARQLQSLSSPIDQYLLTCAALAFKIQPLVDKRKNTLEFQKPSILSQSRYKICNKKSSILKKRGLTYICALRNKDIRVSLQRYSAIMNSTSRLSRHSAKAKLLLRIKKTKTNSQSWMLDMNQNFRGLRLSIRQMYRSSKINLDSSNRSMKVKSKSTYRNTTKKCLNLIP